MNLSTCQYLYNKNYKNSLEANSLWDTLWEMLLQYAFTWHFLYITHFQQWVQWVSSVFVEVQETYSFMSQGIPVVFSFSGMLWWWGGIGSSFLIVYKFQKSSSPPSFHKCSLAQSILWKLCSYCHLLCRFNSVIILKIGIPKLIVCYRWWLLK